MIILLILFANKSLKHKINKIDQIKNLFILIDLIFKCLAYGKKLIKEKNVICLFKSMQIVNSGKYKQTVPTYLLTSQ